MEANEQINYRSINLRCYCFSLRKGMRAITQLYDRYLEPAGIRATQFTLLVSLASVSAHTLTEMANALVMDRTTLTRNLKPLEKLGFIEISKPKDKRSKAYALTSKGRETLNKGIPLWQAVQQKMGQGVGVDRMDNLLKELDVLTRHIAEM